MNLRAGLSRKKPSKRFLRSPLVLLFSMSLPSTIASRFSMARLRSFAMFMAGPGRTRILLAIPLLLVFFLPPASPRTGREPQFRSGRTAVSIGENQGAFLMLSDIHFDPFSNASPEAFKRLSSSPVEEWQSIFESSGDNRLPPEGTDTNYPLLASALDAARNSGAHYDYVLVAGDFLGHRLPAKYRSFKPDGRGYREFAIKTLIFVNRMIEQSFPGVPVYGALGNNDSTGGDYSAPGKALLVALRKEWKVVDARPDAVRDFLRGGFYAVPHPTVPDREFIVLDTSFWSSRYEGGNNRNFRDAGAGELSWLRSTLQQLQAMHKTAALIMHIPPGIDAYASSALGGCNTPALFWKGAYLSAFLELIEEHKAILRDAYAGHTHMDDFRVFTDREGMPYFQTHVVPSISPDHRTRPAFEIGVYDKATGALMDYAATYLKSPPGTGTAGKPLWEPEYDFRQLSGFQSYSPASLETAAALIRSNEAIRKKFIDFYLSKLPSSVVPITKDWLSYSCAQTEMTASAYGKCACPSPAGKN